MFSAIAQIVPISSNLTFKAMGASIWAMKRTKMDSSKDDNVDKVILMDQIDELLKNCDYVCNVLPNTEKTTNCLSNGILQNCHGEFLKINVAQVKRFL